MSISDSTPTTGEDTTLSPSFATQMQFSILLTLIKLLAENARVGRDVAIDVWTELLRTDIHRHTQTYTAL